MTLREWMSETGTTPTALAALLDVHWVTVYKWASGSARPSFDKLLRIEQMTGGRVTASTLAHGANNLAVAAGATDEAVRSAHQSVRPDADTGSPAHAAAAPPAPPEAA